MWFLDCFRKGGFDLEGFEVKESFRVVWVQIG